MSDYINIYDYENEKYPFQIFMAGRGCGKTYSALKGAIELNRKFIYMRRTSVEFELCNDSLKFGEGGNPLKSINDDCGYNYGFLPINKHLSGIYEREESADGKFRYIGAPIGYGCAMTTVHNIRGIDLSDCDELIYDEFIPERHVNKLKGECDALLNAIETIGRNRELKGKPALKVYLLANSNDIYNPIFVGLNIVNNIERMVSQGKEHRYYEERGLAVHLLRNTDTFMEKKSKTSLYKLTEDCEFSDMALNNKFAYNDFSLITDKKLVGYIPVMSIGNIYMYNKKGTNEYHFSYSSAKCKHIDDTLLHDRIYFRRNYGITLRGLYSTGSITFQSYAIKERILDLLEIK